MRQYIYQNNKAEWVNMLLFEKHCRFTYCEITVRLRCLKKYSTTSNSVFIFAQPHAKYNKDIQIEFSNT